MLNNLNIFGHVKWFIDDSAAHHSPPKLNEAIVILILIVAGLIILKLIDGYLKTSGVNERLDRTLRLRPYSKLATPLIRLSAALILVLNLVNNKLLSPNIPADGSVFSDFVFLSFSIIAVLFALGFKVRFAASLLFITFVLIGYLTEPIATLDHLEYLGIAGYLFLAPSDQWSLDYRFGRKKPPGDNLSRYSLIFYRATLGIGLSILAFSEKLLDLSLAQDFLTNYNWNILSIIGLSDRNFIIMAGIIELLIGLSLIFNLATRLTILALLGVMVTTAVLLGLDEVVGHLFIVGIAFAIFIEQKN
ncbi:hypothetical protein KA529_03290 [Candidatus Saccharibacteria bacterium]|nr:hypothetical protein [Candidatus Saccharibacteria bacterium]